MVPSPDLCRHPRGSSAGTVVWMSLVLWLEGFILLGWWSVVNAMLQV